MSKVIYISAIFLLSACALGGGEVRPLYPPFMPRPPEGGPQEFQQGWQDGCETGMAAHGNDVFRSSFDFTQDPSLVLNPIYYKAWKDAENYCRTYIFEYSIRSLDVYCTLDGLNNDCEGNTARSVPFLGGSTDTLGYSAIGGGKTSSGETLFGGHSGIGGISPVLGGGTDGFLGNTASFESFMGW